MERTEHQARTARTLAAVLLAALSMLVAAVFAAPQAEAHQTPGRTIIAVDGNQVRSTRDNHFTYERPLSPGCHTIRVVQRQGGNVVSASQQRACSRSRTLLEVQVDDSDVQITTTQKTISNDDPMSR